MNYAFTSLSARTFRLPLHGTWKHAHTHCATHIQIDYRLLFDVFPHFYCNFIPKWVRTLSTSKIHISKSVEFCVAQNRPSAKQFASMLDVQTLYGTMRRMCISTFQFEIEIEWQQNGVCHARDKHTHTQTDECIAREMNSKNFRHLCVFASWNVCCWLLCCWHLVGDVKGVKLKVFAV